MNKMRWPFQFPINKNHKKRIFLISLFVAFAVCLLVSSNAIFFLLIGLSLDYDLNPIHFLQYGQLAWQDNTLTIKWLIALFMPIAIIVTIIAIMKKERQHFLFGHAHWSTLIEARKAGLFNNDGLIIGKKWGSYLRIGGYEHVFAFAPSGSGKSTSLVIPNLLTWDGSCIATDVKLSLFLATSKFREQHGHVCFLWNPGSRDGKTHCFNPLDWIDKDHALRVDDLQKIAHIFIPDNPKTDPIWTAQPRVLFVALSLYLLDTPGRPTTLGELVRLVKNTDNFSNWLHKMLRERDDLDPLCYRNFNSFLQTEYRLQTNILQSFMSYFELFDNPFIDAATSKSDFDITQLRKIKMTIYVGVSSDNLVRLSPLLTIFYQQVLDALLRSLPDIKVESHGVLLLLDEFSALKRMEVLQKSIGLMREYRIRMLIIIQDLPQIYTVYGHDGGKAFINNKVRIAFAQNDLDAAKLISGWLGVKTVQQRIRNENNGFSSLLNNRESISYTKRELMLPGEIMQLPSKKAIIIVEGNSPVLANKSFWYEDEMFKARILGAVDVPIIQPILIPFDKSLLTALPITEDTDDLKDDD